MLRKVPEIFIIMEGGDSIGALIQSGHHDVVLYNFDNRTRLYGNGEGMNIEAVEDLILSLQVAAKVMTNREKSRA